MISLPILLSEGFVPVLAVGTSVTVGTLLAKKDKQEHTIINIADEFSLPPTKVAKTLKKNPGEKVSKGDALAEKKSLLNKEKIICNVNGTVLRFERDSGRLVIQLNDTPETEGTTLEILSPIDGTVAVCDNEKIVLSTDKDIIVGKSGNGKTAKASLHSVPHTQSDSVEFYHLDGEVIGKIVLGKKFSREVLAKGIGMGVTGILGTEIPEADILYFKDKGMETPVIAIDMKDYDTLSTHAGKDVYVDGKAGTILMLQL